MPRNPLRVWARYWIETAFPLAEAAAALAGEQSSGTFVSVPGETPELKERYGARVEALRALDTVDAPSLPGAGMPGGVAQPRWQRAELDVSWPLDNMGPSLPNLLATVAGNLFELRQFSGLRLLDLALPPDFARANPGPQFGIAGTRRLAGIAQGPLIGTIIKPSVGLSPEATAALAGELAEAGIDFIKDDELQADGPHCPFTQRVDAVMAVLRAHAERTGRLPMYAFNLTGEVDEMRRRHDQVRDAGGTCVMVSLHSIGLTGLLALRRHAQLPIHAHRNGWGLFSRSPHIGVSYVAWQKFWRLAGADQMHVNGLRNKFCEGDESVLASARCCLKPMFDAPEQGCTVMPVFSSGQTVRQAHGTYAALGSADLIHAAGGGLMAHPEGVAAGVHAMRLAWDAAMAGVSLEDQAQRESELRQALEGFSA
ncbi:MAG: ribulose-bisphosphate carboxylase large subunit family protein [Bryobacterales bacterium]|nr:ribulose-bisphosphate carboxylase large subunit family protein [Bryobacterales bacterium]